jgi:hypothetical protein
MKAQIVKSVEDDFDRASGPWTVTNVMLELDGKLFNIGVFYEGPGMDIEAKERLTKVLEFGEWLKTKA